MPALRFILGRAGSGKTHTCIAEIAARLQKAPMGPPLLLVLPDQATFQMERAVVQALPSRGFVRLRVLSFKRLALAILAEVGGLARPALTQTGRQMLLRSLLHEHSEDLQVFGRSARQPGFVSELETMLRELAECGHSPRDAAGAARRLPDTAAKQKLEDLALLWEAYRKALAPRHADPDAYLTTATEKGLASALLRDAEVWVDGFASFTPQEHRMLHMLLQQTRKLHVALCLDPDSWPELSGRVGEAIEVERSLSVDPLGLFHRPEETCARLLLGARLQGLPVLPPTLLRQSPPRFLAPELAHLEVEFPSPLPHSWPASVTAVRIVEAANRRAEVEAVGREILRLCREEGYRFRDIGVIARDLHPYHELLSAVFAEMGIPCFVDRRTSIAHHPVIELLRSAVEVAVTRWELQPLMRCLKTDLLPISRADVDALENYALEHGLRGSAWSSTRPWTYGLQRASADTLAHVQHLDAVRREVFGILAPVVTVLERPRLHAVEACEALYRLLADAGVPERLEEWSQGSAARGQVQEAMTHQQVWDACVELLEELVEALGTTEMAATEFEQILEAGLENLQLGLIPPVLDQVLVGAIDRSRQPDLRAAFVVGVGERSFPAVGSEDTLFGEAERQLLAECDFQLGPTASERTLHEQYLGYIAFTRAAEYLWISYPLAGDDGRALAPSPFVSRLRAILPALKIQQAGNEPEGAVAEALPWLTSPRKVAALAVRCLRSDVTTGWLAAAQMHSNDSDVQFVLQSLHHRNTEAALPPVVAQALVGDPLHASISRFESFAACPFQHFAQYMLRLEEREEYRVQHTDIGLLVHETLHRLVQHLQQQNRSLVELAQNEARELIDRIVDEVAPRLHHQVFMSNARYQYLVERLKRLLHTTLQVWFHHSDEGQFRPLATEVSFGGRGDALPGPEMALPGGRRLFLHGRIDRIDACQEQQVVYVRVIDYKGSGGGFSVADAYHGLRLQLPVYLDVAREAVAAGLLGGDGRALVLPAGAYYFNVREPTVDATQPLDDEEWEKRLLKSLRLAGMTLDSAEAIRLAERSGQGRLIPARLTKDGQPYRDALVVSDERMQQLFRVVRQRMQEFSTRILAGEVSPRPFRYAAGRSGCRFCRYHEVCHFDPQVPGDFYRPLEYRENRRAWEWLDTGTGGMSGAAVDR
jgi:ATP-dependent helicase/nuclease subunit B